MRAIQNLQPGGPHPHAAAITVLPLALLAAALGCNPPGSPGPTAEATDDSPVVARVEGLEIRQAELDDWIREQLFQEQVASKGESDQYGVRQQYLERLVSERVIEVLGERRGVGPQAVIAEQIEALGPVSDQEVKAFYERHKDRFRGPETALEDLSDQIREFLANERPEQALRKLRREAAVDILLEPPRIEVAAVGPARGPEDARVTIVEFSDFQCPFCTRAEPIVQQVLERYPNDVRLVYRHFPLESIHPRARPAAEASLCAHDQGRFWEYHQLLFSNQRKLSDEDLLAYAGTLGLDLDAFRACAGSEEIAGRVQRDLDDAEAAGVDGTPAFFVNGIMLSGARPLQSFVELIERELARGPRSS